MQLFTAAAAAAAYLLQITMPSAAAAATLNPQHKQCAAALQNPTAAAYLLITMPSAAARMPRKLSSACRVSTLARILVCVMPSESRNSRASRTSSLQDTNRDTTHRQLGTGEAQQAETQGAQEQPRQGRTSLIIPRCCCKFCKAGTQLSLVYRPYPPRLTACACRRG